MQHRMDLAEAEKNIILKRRAQEVEDTARAHYRLLIHDVAHRFAVWKVENGAGSSYSTFCDDFGYDNPGVDRPRLHKNVLAVIKFVRERVT
jgi:hypothetical protein